jgi:predicted metal-dependent peptidase
MTDRIEKSRIQLIKNEPFFGKILCMCVIKESTEVPTAGARITKEGRFEVVYNRTFMEAQSDQIMVGVWKHEVCHLLFNHTMENRKNKKRTNVAMDLAINNYIGKDNLPKGGMFAEDFGFPKYLTTNQYYEMLGGDEKDESDQEKSYEFDDHSGLGGEAGESVSAELQKAIAEQAAKEAAKGISAGNLPLDMLKSLDIDIYSEGTLSWKTLLRKYAKDTLTNTKISTRNKPNRRVGFSADGSTDDRLPSIFIAIDESGSIDNTLLAEFSEEINRLFKEYSGSVKVLHFDTRISKVETFKKSVTRLERYGGGGTDIQPVMDVFDAEKGDLLIAFTDGYFFSKVTCKRGKNVLFLIYNNNSFVPEFGKAVVIK